MSELRFFYNTTNCNSSVISVNEGCIIVSNAAEKSIQLYAQSEECYSCDYQPWYTVPAVQNVSFVVQTRYPILLRYYFNVSKWCLRNVTFKEYGVYGWNISDDVCSDLYVIKEPVPEFLPIIVAASFLLIPGILSYAFSVVVESDWFTNLRSRGVSSSEVEKDLGSPKSGDAPPKMKNNVPQNKCQQKRVASLDVFRGLCVALMIFLHAGGGYYAALRLPPWNGITTSNLPLPWFLWIMGLSLPLSLRSQLRSGKSRLHLLRQVLRRSFVLITLGLIVTNSNNRRADVRTLHLFGALQDIGVCYMMIGVLESLLMSQEEALRYGRWIVVSDIIESWRQWLLVLTLAGAHTGISLALPVPGCPRGYLGPGGWHMHGQYANCTAGAAGYIERLIVTPKHLHILWETNYVYHTHQRTYPSGILPTLTRSLLVYLGVHAGRILQCYKYAFMRISRWLSWGLVTGIIAGMLCSFSKEEGIIPLNWYIVSLSFVLATASMAFILLSILYFVVDCRHWWSGAPFLYAGRNALLLFIGHHFTINLFPWSWEAVYGTHAEYLAMDLWSTSLWLIIAYIMFQRNFFVTV